jgi:hypothetical protein
VGAKPGVFTLTMPVRKSNHLVTWFTDRPVRDAGHLPLESFVNLGRQFQERPAECGDRCCGQDSGRHHDGTEDHQVTRW